MSDHRSWSLSRRRLLGMSAAGLVLAGCSGTSGGPKSDASRKAGGTSKSPARGGTFRFAPASFAGTSSADPYSINGGWAMRHASFDSLLARSHKNVIEPALAESCAAEHGDQSVWTIRLRDGVEFQNGKTLTAEDVIYSIKRALDPKNPTVGATLLERIDPKAIQKLDARTLRLHLKGPNSQLPVALAAPEFMILPTDFDPKNPIGTGPFKQQSFTVGQRWIDTRHKNYWRSGEPYLDKLEFIGFAEQTARNNALIAGQIDGADKVDFVQIPQLRSRPEFQIVISDTGDYQLFEMRCDKGAFFEDVRVRKAFRLMVDRPQMVKLVYGGYGGLGNDVGVWHKFDPAVDPDLPQREQDIKQAKALLKAAGKDGSEISLRTANLSTGAIKMSNLMVQYARRAGIRVKLQMVADSSQYYGSKEYQTSQFKIDGDRTETLAKLVRFAYMRDGVFNNTGYDNTQVAKLYHEAMAASGPKYNDIMHSVSKLIWEDGPYIAWGRSNSIDVYTNDFTGAVPDATGEGLNGYRFGELGRA